MTNKHLLLGVSLLALGGTLSSRAHAQTAATAGTNANSSNTTLEQITVTAERRNTNVQKTAVSVAVRSGDDLLKQGKTSLAQILEDVPGVTVNAPVAGDNPGVSITIRGVAPDVVPTGDTSVASTGVYVDGINSGIGGDYDIQRVEVLRGPQGTLYGRSATGGVVATYTRDPVLGKLDGYVNLELGSYALRHLTAAVNVPLGDVLAVRAVGNIYDQNGFQFGGGGSTKRNEARVKLLYQPNADLSVLLGWSIQRDSGKTGDFSAAVYPNNPNQPIYTYKPVFSLPDSYNQYWAKLNWNLGIGTLTYLPALHNYTTPLQNSVLDPGVFDQNLTSKVPLDQITTQELRLASNEGSPITWIVGGYYYNRLYKSDTSTTWEPSNALTYAQDIDKSTENLGAFGEATYPFAESWKITAGLRYDYTRIRDDLNYLNNNASGLCDGVPGCGPLDPTFGLPEQLQDRVVSGPAGISSANNVTYKLRLEDDFTPANLVYAMISSGFLPGDLAVSPQMAPSGPGIIAAVFPYKPETLTAYELGSKNRFLDNSLQINGDVYYYDYSGYQQFVNTSHSPAPDISVITTPAKMYGAELEALWRFTSNDRLSASLGYVNAQYVNKSAFFAQFVTQSTIPGIAPLSLQAGYDHTFDFPDGSKMVAHADVHYTNSYDEGALATSEVAEDALVRVAGEPIGDINLTWTSANEKYSIDGYIRNVADSVYKTGAFLPFPGAASVSPSAPRIFGMVLHAAY